jgi:hypothetical protein
MDRAVNHHQPPTVAESDAASYLGFSPAALRVWRRERRGPAFIRQNRSIRYLVADLDAWLTAHRVEPKQDSARTPEGHGR